MTDYAPVMEILEAMVPLPRTLGATYKGMGPGWCETALSPRDDIANHIGTIHAGALFTLGEMASGGAMASIFFELMGSGEAVPLAAKAGIEYRKVAKGAVTARAEIAKGDGTEGATEEEAAALFTELKEIGKVSFPVRISIKDVSGEETTVMTVSWHVRIKKT
ncbi:MAG: DUF4442 domain-containing protein [Hyphomonadaceae bacterium]